jgi:hypothetical protein
VKRTRRDEPIAVVTHICMETTQGNSLYLKLAKRREKGGMGKGVGR